MKALHCVWVLALLAGCAVGPHYRTPKTAAPDQWGETLKGGAAAKPVELAQWWTLFKDPTLDSLIERAVVSNLDLRIAEARVREARAARGYSLADFLPLGAASATYKHAQIKKPSAGPTGIVGTIGAIAGVGQPDIKRQVDLHQAGFDASWELDVFGGNRRAAQAAKADVDAARDNRNGVLVTLMAEVARNYLDLRGSQNRLTIAEENIKGQQETLELTRARHQAGLTSELDVKRAEAQLSSTQSQVPNLETACRLAVHRLGVLLGQAPGALSEELSAQAALPAAPPEVPVGLPSDLLRRRPDVAASERQLAAATARVGEAQAEWFPKFSLTGSLTLEASALDGLTSGANRMWSFGPSVRWPILDAAHIWSNVKLKNARQEQALQQFQKSVLTALEDTENALAAYANEQTRLHALEQTVDANRQAVNMANELYSKGLVDFLNVLDGERSLYSAEDQMVQSRTTVLTNLVALYKALGGGWEAVTP